MQRAIIIRNEGAIKLIEEEWLDKKQLEEDIKSDDIVIFEDYFWYTSFVTESEWWLESDKFTELARRIKYHRINGAKLVYQNGMSFEEFRDTYFT